MKDFASYLHGKGMLLGARGETYFPGSIQVETPVLDMLGVSPASFCTCRGFCADLITQGLGELHCGCCTQECSYRCTRMRGT